MARAAIPGSCRGKRLDRSRPQGMPAGSSGESRFFSGKLPAICLPLIALLASAHVVAAQVAGLERDVVARNGVVVSVSGEASDVGIAILRRGGNALDAAVATALALAVTYPPAGNIGGGGFMMIHLASSGQTVTVEYRETAPAASTQALFDKRLTPTSRGHLSVGVPGTVRGLELAHRRYGTLPWSELVEPAVGLAERGFRINGQLAQSLNGILGRRAGSSEFCRVLGKPDGSAWQTGDRLVQQDLAGTMRLLRDHGPGAFYTGAIADQIVREMRAGGGIITQHDLAAYQAHIRVPVHGTYRGYDIFGPAPPSSGGTVLVEMLNILENFDLAGHGRDSAATTHLMIEAMRRAYFDRAMFLGDPAFSEIPSKLISKSYARELASQMDRRKATPSQRLGAEVLARAEGKQTTHFSIVDRQGNAVSNTYTLQNSYGSMVVVRGAGFLLNNEMTDFNLHPGHTDREGHIGTDPNLVEPGKRMLSSQNPTLVLNDGKVVLVTGSPGGRTIINTVLGIVVGVIDFGMDIRSAVDAPRLHHQWMPDVVRYEPGRLSDEICQQLESMGHQMQLSPRQGDAHSIWIDPETGLRHGAADRRRDGRAAGY